MTVPSFSFYKCSEIRQISDELASECFSVYILNIAFAEDDNQASWIWQVPNDLQTDPIISSYLKTHNICFTLSAALMDGVYNVHVLIFPVIINS